VPESERAVLLERRHGAKHAMIHEVRAAPFNRFHNLGTRRVHQFSDAIQHGLGEIGRFGDVRVDTRVFFGHVIVSWIRTEAAKPSGQRFAVLRLL
jgi:hypothetical protein